MPHDTTHATVRRVHLGTDVLTVHGSGWDLGRYVLWSDGSLREVGDRIGWVDEESGAVRLRGDARYCVGPGSGAPAPRGGVWATSVLVPHVDVDDVGARTDVVVADDGVSRWADHPHVPPQRPRRGAAPAPARPRGQWPDLAEDLPARVARRLGT
ncbi:hypothetical protein WDZ17_02630 [Pseudokineococcus basanitobsidens]|uniref:Uncharacterized protein n=1 Tax=Pseudokineococcus basanitobsidens TaxID=1926649 RepID=A0ABU8RGI1_9ACTN